MVEEQPAMTKEYAENTIDQLALITDAIPVLISYIDTSLRYRFVNLAYEKWFGHSRKDILHKSMAEVLGEKAVETLRKHIDTVLSGKQTEWESEINYKNLGLRYVHGLYMPDIAKDGSVRGFVVLVTDMTERKKMEENLKISEQELRRSRDQLRIIFEGVADGILVQDRQFRCVLANEVGAKMCGFPNADAFCNASVDELLKKFEIQDETGNPLPFDKLPARLALSGVKEPPETTLRVKNLSTGAETWSIVSARPIFDKEGQPTLAVSIFRDITEKKLEQDWQDFLVKSSEAFSLSLDFEETLQRVANSAVPRLADWCAIDIVSNKIPMSRVVAHKDPEKLILAQSLRSKFPTNWDAKRGVGQVIRTGKSELYSHISDEFLSSSARSDEHLQMLKGLNFKSVMVVPLTGNNNILGAITFVGAESGKIYKEEDLVQAEEFARRAGLAIENARLYQEVHFERQRLGAMLEQMPAGVILADVSGKLVHRNHLLDKILGGFIPANNIEEYGQYVGYKMDGSAYKPNDWPLARSLTHGEIVNNEEVDFIRLDGKRSTLSISSAPIRDEKGHIVAGVVVHIDVSNQKQIEKQLQEAVRARDEFISICSHELKTPVTSLKLQFQMADRQMKRNDPEAYAPERTKKRVELANRQLDRMTKLIEDMLDVSRISMGKLQFGNEVVDLKIVVTEVIERFSEQFEILNIPVKFESSMSEAKVLGDRFRLEQVLSNLLTNAVKYGLGKPIDVTLACTGSHIRMMVEDYGIGIKAESLNRIFNRFERAVPSANFSGLGLGLYISRQIVEAHRGKIWAESEPEKGTRFIVEFSCVKS